MSKLIAWLREKAQQLFTEPGNKTLCPIRVFGIPFAVISSIAFFGFSYWSIVVKANAFDYVAFAGGLSGIWGVVSLAIMGQSHIRRGSDND